MKTLVVALAFGAVFYSVLLDLWYTWTHSQDWSHGPIIPLFSIYLVYMNWDRIRTAPIRQAWVGLPILLLALIAFQWALWIRPTTYIQQAGMLVALLGVLILLCGLPMMRVAWVPWLYLFFAIPFPKAVYYGLTDPLRLGSNGATGLLAMVPSLQIEPRRLGDGVHVQRRLRLARRGRRVQRHAEHDHALRALGVAAAFSI